MPEIAGNPEWAIDIERVHDWLESRADRVERREMHGRRRYFVDGGMVEVVDPVGNEDFCANCHRVRVTHDGKFKGCLNRADDHRSMGNMSKAEIRETFRNTVANRVPYYGEYMRKDDEGTWQVNETYLSPPDARPDAAVAGDEAAPDPDGELDPTAADD
jgi:cyclic pyranopterin phosphate synthase